MTVSVMSVGSRSRAACVYMSVCPSVSVRLSVTACVYLCLSVRLCLSVSLSVRLSVCVCLWRSEAISDQQRDTALTRVTWPLVTNCCTALIGVVCTRIFVFISSSELSSSSSSSSAAAAAALVIVQVCGSCDVTDGPYTASNRRQNRIITNTRLTSDYSLYLW